MQVEHPEARQQRRVAGDMEGNNGGGGDLIRDGGGMWYFKLGTLICGQVERITLLYR